MSLLSAVSPVVVAVGAAMAVELRRLSEVQMAVAEVRDVSATTRVSTRRPHSG